MMRCLYTELARLAAAKPPPYALRLTRPCPPLLALAHRCLWRRLPKHSVIIQAGLVICSRRSFFLPLKLPFILLFWPPRAPRAPCHGVGARRATTVNRRADRQSRGEAAAQHRSSKSLLLRASAAEPRLHLLISQWTILEISYKMIYI
jgi:hypothetical protein